MIRKLVLFISFVILGACQVDDTAENTISRLGNMGNEEPLAQINDIDGKPIHTYTIVDDQKLDGIDQMTFIVNHSGTGEGTFRIGRYNEIETATGWAVESTDYEDYGMYAIEVDGPYYFIDTEYGEFTFEKLSGSVIEDEHGNRWSF